MKDDTLQPPGWGSFLSCLGLGDGDGVDFAWGNALRVLFDDGCWRNSAQRNAVLDPVIEEVRGTDTGVALHVRMHGASLGEWERILRRDDAVKNGRRPSDDPAVIASIRAREAAAMADRGSYLMARIQAAECMRAALALGVSPEDAAAELLRLIRRWRVFHARKP